jgi:hypothetical protein
MNAIGIPRRDFTAEDAEIAEKKLRGPQRSGEGLIAESHRNWT